MVRKEYSKKLKKEMWGYDIRVSDGNGKKKRIQSFEFYTKKDAEAAVTVIRKTEREAKYGVAPIITRPTLKELIENRLPTIDKRAEKTRANRVLNTWISLLTRGIKIDEITTPIIRMYVDKRLEDNQSSSSINRELNIIASTLHKASEFFPELNQWKVPKIPRLKGSKSRRERIVSDEEYRKMIGYLIRPPDEKDGERQQNRLNAYHARLRVAAIFQFAMNTGMRPKEIFTLQWDDIDYDGNRIKVRGTKTQEVVNSTRYVPLSTPVKEILESQKEYKEKRGYIFTKGGNPNPKHYRILRDTAEAVGIKYGKSVDKGLILYSARHTFTTRLLQSGVDIRTVGDITGHTDRELVLHYSHVTPESTARAIQAIEALESRRKNNL